MEYTRQIDYIDVKYRMVAKKRIIYTLPLKVHDLVLQSRGKSEGLKKNLLGLKLKKINQFLLYDSENIFGKRLRSQPNPSSFKVDSRPKLKQWRNLTSKDKVIPTTLIMKDLLPSWMSFYEKKANFDPKVDSISKKSLTTLRSEKWSEEKIATFVQYKVKFKNRHAPLEFDLDDNFKEMW